MTRLLDDEGSASMATLLMMSHHAFRRDLGRFGAALARLRDGGAVSPTALRDEWQSFHLTLHGHHEAEDTRMFPSLRAEHAALEPIIDRLAADHRRIDPLLERGGQAFARLPEVADAAALVAELDGLLHEHLAVEESSVVPLLRGAKGFPPPSNDAELELYAQGFAWSSHGIASEVLEQVYAMLPEALQARLPAARQAFAARCVRVWGSDAAGASHTSVPAR